MIYNDKFIANGAVFPPSGEIKRLSAYSDNRKLFEGDIASVLKPYRERIKNITRRFSELERYAYGMDTFELDLNYFQLATIKLGDMVCGEPPTITSSEDSELGDILSDTKFMEKLLTIVYDISMLGDSVVRLKKNKAGKADFVVISPEMWFPIVSREDCNDIECQVLAWTEIDPTTENESKKRYLLKAQYHYKGYYIMRTYKVNDYRDETTISASGQNFNSRRYYIGEREGEDIIVRTGFSDNAIIVFHNTMTSGSAYGLNDYDRITPIIAELQVRYALESLILDKHSCPTLTAPEKALNLTSSGEWILRTGGVIPTEPNDIPPSYLIWDASLSANHTEIEKLEKHLYSLSEMGAVISDDSFGASQGFEALETRMTNARLKARRVAGKLTSGVKRLVSLLSELGYSKIAENDINVYWNDGLPNNEYRETDIATRKLQSGLFDSETILMEHFGKSKDSAKEIADKARENLGGSFTLAEDNSEVE